MNFAVAIALTFTAAGDAESVIVPPGIRAPGRVVESCLSRHARSGRDRIWVIEFMVEPDGIASEIKLLETGGDPALEQAGDLRD